jgi:hypothetical protein
MKGIENANLAKMLALVERFGHPDGPEEVRRDLEREQAASEAPLTKRFAEIRRLVVIRRAAMARSAAEVRQMHERRVRGTPKLPGDDALDAASAAVLRLGEVADRVLAEAPDPSELARPLRRIKRREGLLRTGWLFVEAVTSFLVFALGFPSLVERLRGGVPWLGRDLAAVGLAVEAQSVIISFAATVALFVIERWYLSPQIEGRVANRVRDGYMKAVSSYFVERIMLEYTLARMEHLLSTSSLPATAREE